MAVPSSDPTHFAFYAPAQTALLLLDFHNAFVDGFNSPQVTAAVEKAAKIRAWAKDQPGMHVVHGLINVDEKPFSTCKDWERFEKIVSTMRNTPGAEEPGVLKDSTSTTQEPTFFRTPGYTSALKSPGLQDYLHANGIKSLLLAGLSTSGCVLRTAIPATDEEFVVTVLTDACADPKEGIHEFVVNNIAGSRAYCITADEFVEAYTKHRH